MWQQTELCVFRCVTPFGVTHFFVLREVIEMPDRITIATKNGDAELIKQIVQYQKENNFTFSTDAVRDLCKKALAFKKLVER